MLKVVAHEEEEPATTEDDIVWVVRHKDSIDTESSEGYTRRVKRVVVDGSLKVWT